VKTIAHNILKLASKILNPAGKVPKPLYLVRCELLGGNVDNS
jgi:hypothetical protein